MDTNDPFFRHTETAGNGADVRAERSGGLVLLTPLTPQAEAWLRKNADEEASWAGNTLVVEPRYFPPVADGLIASGFNFERDALPN